MWLGLIYAYNVKNVDSQDVIFLKNRRQGNNFGHSVALAKNYVFVGAPHDANHGNVFKCSFNANDLNKQNLNICSKLDGKFCCYSKIFLSEYISWILVDSPGLMTKKTNKNLFGMTVTALNDKVVSCAHMEPINGETFQESMDKKYYPQLGKLFKLFKNIATLAAWITT